MDYDKLTDERLGELSSAIRARVQRAREAQRERFADTGRGLVRAAMQQLQMSARAFHRILKLARLLILSENAVLDSR